MKPYQSCETCPKCWSGNCRQCPMHIAELKAFKEQTEGKIERMAKVIWHPRKQPLQSLSTERANKVLHHITFESKFDTQDTLSTNIQPYSVARSITSDFESEDKGSNPFRAFPARLAIRFSLQDKNSEQDFLYHNHPLLAEQKLASFKPEVTHTRFIGCVSCQPSCIRVVI